MAVALAAALAPQLAAADTFSIAAADVDSGDLGSAGASCVGPLSSGVGAFILSDIIPGWGVIHTQAYYEAANQRMARERMLAGDDPAAIVTYVTENDVSGQPGRRQYGIVDLRRDGDSAAFTGSGTTDYKGHLIGHGYAVQGNILSGPEVLEDMERVFLDTAGPLPARLMSALEAAKVVGADTRCAGRGTSSRSAFLRVVRGNAARADLELVVPDSAVGEDPIDLLRAAYDKAMQAPDDDAGTSVYLPLVGSFPPPAGPDQPSPTPPSAQPSPSLTVTVTPSPSATTSTVTVTPSPSATTSTATVTPGQTGTGPAPTLSLTPSATPSAEGTASATPGTGRPDVAGFAYTEWSIPGPSARPHDIGVAPDGGVWYSGQESNQVGRLDPATGEFRQWDVPTANSGPHGLTIDQAGGVWITEIAAGKVARFDPQAETFREYPLPDERSRPHTIMEDASGAIWFTEQASHSIARLDPANRVFERFNTPTRPSGPYGLDIAPDGSIWFALFQSGADRIGRFNPTTKEMVEFVPPTLNQGARRLAIDSAGRVWVAEFRSGDLSMFDPVSSQWRVFRPPTPNGQPYAVVIDAWDGVWLSQFRPHQLVFFDPASERFVEFPLPSPNAACRFLDVAPDGAVWCPESGTSKIARLGP